MLNLNGNKNGNEGQYHKTVEKLKKGIVKCINPIVLSAGTISSFVMREVFAHFTYVFSGTIGYFALMAHEPAYLVLFAGHILYLPISFMKLF